MAGAAGCGPRPRAERSADTQGAAADRNTPATAIHRSPGRAQRGVVGVAEKAAAKTKQRRFNAVAQTLASGDALLAAGLAPMFERAIGRRRTRHAETAGVEEEPQSGEIGEGLALEDAAQIGLDDGRPCQAGIIAQQAQFLAVAY